MARPRIYNSEMVQKVKDYIESCVVVYSNTIVGYSGPNREIPVEKVLPHFKVPSIEGLAGYLGVSKETIYAWEKEKEPEDEKTLRNPEFSDVIAELRAKQAEMLINYGLSGTFNPVIAKVLLTKHGYREGIDQTTDDKPLPTPILNGISTNHSDEENSKTP